MNGTISKLCNKYFNCSFDTLRSLLNHVSRPHSVFFEQIVLHKAVRQEASKATEGGSNQRVIYIRRKQEDYHTENTVWTNIQEKQQILFRSMVYLSFYLLLISVSFFIRSRTGDLAFNCQQKIENSIFCRLVRWNVLHSSYYCIIALFTSRFKIK